MKKCYLKKWVENILLIINVILMIMLITEHNDLLIMTIKNIICLLIMYFNHRILIKYSRLLNEV